MFAKYRIFIHTFVIILLSMLVNCKSISKRDINGAANLNQEYKLPLQQNIDVFKQIHSGSEFTNRKDAVMTATNQEEMFKQLDKDNPRTTDNNISADISRNQQNPEFQKTEGNIMMENIRNRLQAARSKLKDMKRKNPVPTIFVIDPNHVTSVKTAIDSDHGPTDQNQIISITSNVHPKTSTHFENPEEQLSKAKENTGDTVSTKHDKDINIDGTKLKSTENLTKLSTAEEEFNNKRIKKAKTHTNISNQTILNTASNTNSTSDLIKENTNPNLESPNIESSEILFEKLLNDSLKKKDKRLFQNEGLEQLIEIREEINKLRNIMQVLQEQQLKENFTNAFSNNLNLEEQKELEEFVKKLKFGRQVLINPKNDVPETSDTSNISNAKNKESEKTGSLTKDINKLRITVLDFMRKIDNQKIKAETLEKLEQQFVNQQEEIENLKSLVEKVIPPLNFVNQSNYTTEFHSNQINNEKERLHNEIINMQDVFNDFNDFTEETTENILGDIHAKQPTFEDISGNNPIILQKDTNDDDLDFIKIFQKITNSKENVDTKAIGTKIEKLERDLKDLENIHHRTKQEMLLEKLESDIKNLKPINSNGDDKIKTEKQEVINVKQTPSRNINVEEKIDELAKQIKSLSKPETRDLSDGSIEKELNKLQEKIDKLGQKREESIEFQQHLVPPPPDFQHVLNIGQPENSFASHLDNQHFENTPNVPGKPHLPSNYKEAGGTSNIFQLPFCLQRIPQHEYAPSHTIIEPVYPIQQKIGYSTNEYQINPNSDYTNHNILIPQTLHYLPHSLNNAAQHTYDENSYITASNTESNHFNPSINTKSYPQLVDSYSDRNKIANFVDIYKPTQNNLEGVYSQGPYEKNKLAEEIKILEDALAIFREKININSNYNYRSELRSKRSTDNNELENIVRNLEQRINYLKSEMTHMPDYKTNVNNNMNNLEPQSARSSYEYNQYYPLQSYKPKKDYGINMKKEEKFDKLFVKLLKFILHKVGISTPYILEFIFGSDSYNDDYQYNQNNQYDQYNQYNNKGYDLQYNYDNYNDSFDQFGLIGFLPAILLRILSKIPYFIRLLQRNTFIKNFLVPGGVILIVNGLLAFLVWWFSPQDFNNNDNYISSYTSNYNVQPYYS